MTGHGGMHVVVLLHRVTKTDQETEQATESMHTHYPSLLLSTHLHMKLVTLHAHPASHFCTPLVFLMLNTQPQAGASISTTSYGACAQTQSKQQSLHVGMRTLDSTHSQVLLLLLKPANNLKLLQLSRPSIWLQQAYDCKLCGRRQRP